ncbi:bem46 protein, variant [Cryptotrichosporon argae]
MDSRTLITGVKVVGGITAALPVLALGALWWFQRRMIYPSNLPEGSRTHVPLPTEVGLPYEHVTLTTRDGIRIRAYVIPARRDALALHTLRAMSGEQVRAEGERRIREWADELGRGDGVAYAKSRPTVVLFHANAGNMGHRIPIARKFAADLQCNVFMLSYRGYGLSEGHPSEHGLKVDVRTAIEYISTHPLLKDTKLVVYGQSIGGAVCLYAASAFPDLVSGIIVENTFLSLTRLVPYILPYVPAFLLPVLLTERWDARTTVPLIPERTPFLMLSGIHDRLVPPAEMRALRALREERADVSWTEVEGEHNDTYLKPGYWEAVRDWLEREIEGKQVGKAE